MNIKKIAEGKFLLIINSLGIKEEFWMIERLLGLDWGILG